MKTHIFIATTQGLVAIQNITSIDDEDISSVVSINGTSTTANISNSYHNFVKKGVGIIHQQFGACSYRVDISARIDQGNSWQVAMYLAHLAQSKGILGNGVVTKDDMVICATGEVNTTNLQILAVDEVAVKLKLAQHPLEQWAALGAKVQFLLPKANQSEVDKNPVTLFVSNLEQAAGALPENTQEVAVSSRYPAVIGSVVLLLALAFGLYTLTSQQSSNRKPANDIDNISLIAPNQSIQLVALLKHSETCAKTSAEHVSLSNQVFANLGLNQLCSLTLQTSKPIAQLFLIARDAYTVLPLSKNATGWQIPLPKNRSTDRSYFLVTTTQSLSEDKIEQLRLFREAMPKPDMLTKSALIDWLETHGMEFAVYEHKLVVKY